MLCYLYLICDRAIIIDSAIKINCKEALTIILLLRIYLLCIYVLKGDP